MRKFVALALLFACAVAVAVFACRSIGPFGAAGVGAAIGERAGKP